MSTISVPLAPRLTRVGRGRAHNAVATGVAPEQADGVGMTAPQGDESDELVERAAHSVRQAATLAAVGLLTMAIVGGAAVVLARRTGRARAPKS